jgi:hypothetical protein
MIKHPSVCPLADKGRHISTSKFPVGLAQTHGPHEVLGERQENPRFWTLGTRLGGVRLGGATIRKFGNLNI